METKYGLSADQTFPIFDIWQIAFWQKTSKHTLLIKAQYIVLDLSNKHKNYC